MDESNDLLASCFTLSNLLDAADECEKGVAWKPSVQRFMIHRLTECSKLQDAILRQEWEPRKGRPFQVHERGKARWVVPPMIEARVAERCFCDQQLIPFINAHTSPECSACIKGRGLSYAMEHVRAMLEAAPPGAWVFQYDFHSYFHSINRTLMLGMLEQYFPAVFVDFISKCVGGPGIGLDLGSHVSQLLATWYPTPLDHHLESLPGFIGFHRYMDDCVSVFDNRDHAMSALQQFPETAKHMNLDMNPNKTHVNRATAPLVFCKTRFVKRADGVRMTIRKTDTRHSIKHAKNVVRRSKDVPIQLRPVHDSMLGHFDRADNKMSRLLDERIDWGRG